MVMQNLFNGTFNGKKVLLTGHTGFKGSWLSIVLNQLGANVYGYALEPNTKPNLFELAKVNELISSTIGDIRNYDFLIETFQKVQPDIVIHMAAQALVRESYNNPRETYEVNVMGTVNVLEACRLTKSVKVVLNVTTDKCYENKEWHWGYREYEPMGGYDPYSNSKGCSELVTSSYKNSFFNPEFHEKHGVSIASARAGNVIGGGDWSNDRLIPDFIKAIMKGENVTIRSPFATRPWQHVLEPLTGYLTLCEKLYNNGSEFSQAWNFGPEDHDSKNVEWIISEICKLWGDEASFKIDNSPQPHEANYLKLDCSKSKALLQWYPKWTVKKALESIVVWTKDFQNKKEMRDVCIKQINEYYNC